MLGIEPGVGKFLSLAQSAKERRNACLPTTRDNQSDGRDFLSRKGLPPRVE